jgi:hypothetical protein
MLTVQVVDEPEQAPPQPPNVTDVPAEAVSVTSVPDPNDSVQSLGQLSPAGALETAPGPVTATSSGYSVAAAHLNVASPEDE